MQNMPLFTNIQLWVNILTRITWEKWLPSLILKKKSLDSRTALYHTFYYIDDFLRNNNLPGVSQSSHLRTR